VQDNLMLKAICGLLLAPANKTMQPTGAPSRAGG
jgi:hypothetical protein